ncbi:hypothetical protein BC830DRAFT_431043 [Chytriomyces sp. MP71]|nr:hypothetical protein BC830DRAFT_431043 [Chytriomyces sp. MP71]
MFLSFPHYYEFLVGYFLNPPIPLLQNFLKTLLDGLTSVINRPTKPNTDLSSLRFKIRIVTRLLAHAMTMPHTNLIQQKSHTGSDSLVHPRNRMAGQAAPAGLPRQSQSFLALKHVVPAANVKLDEKTLKKLRDFNVQLQELREMLQKGASPLNSNAPAAGAANAADVIDLSESLTLPAVPVPVPAVVLTSGPAPALAASSPLPAPTIASSSGSSIPVNSPFAKVPTTAPPSIPSQSALSTTAAIKPVHPPPPSIASPQIQRRQSDVLSPVNPSSAMSETPLSVQTARTPVASLGQRVMASNSPTLSRPLSANQLNPQLLNNFASPTLAHTSVSLRGNAPQQFVQAQQAQFVQQPNYQIQQQLSQNMGNFAIPSHQQVLPQQQQQPLFAAPSPSQFQPQFAQTPQSYQQQFQQQTLQPQYGQIPPSQVQGLPNLQASYSLSNPQTISHLPLLQQAQPSQAMPVNLQNLSQHPLLQPPISMFGGTSSSSSSSSNSGFLDPVCWFCGQTGHTAESCVKVHPQTIDTTCFEYLEAYFKSGKLPANRYEALRALAHSRLEQKQRLAREAAARIAQNF